MPDPVSVPAAEIVTADDLIDVPAVPVASAPAAETPAAPPPPPAAPSTAPAADAIANPFAGVKDSRGVEFHPAKFRLKDGRPQLDKLGRFVPLGIGRNGKDGAAPAPAAETPAADTPPPSSSGSRLPPDDATAPAADAPAEFSAEMSVEVAIGLVQAVLIMIGQEEGILDEMEQRLCRGPFQRLVQKYNLGSKMTPELESAAIVAMLILRRLKKPKTQTWFQQKLAWLRGWWISMRVKKAVPTDLPSSN